MENSSEEIKKAWELLAAQKKAETKNQITQSENLDPKTPQSFKIEEHDTIKLDLTADLFDWSRIAVDLNLKDEDEKEWETILECGKLDSEINLNEEFKNERNPLSDCEDAINELFASEEQDCATSIFETCAWYTSYHYSASDWGMHIYEDCLIKSAKHIKKYHNYKKEDCVLAAFIMIFCHELFHHLTDIAITSMELIKSDPNIYIEYSKNVYKVDFNKQPYGALEESLANRYLFGRYKSCKLNKHYLNNLLKREPIGYKHFDKYIGKKFTEGRRHLLNQAFECKSPSIAKLPYEHIYPLLDHKNFAIGIKMPVYLHRKKGTKEKITFKIK
jgi:hypothetical protein